MTRMTAFFLGWAVGGIGYYFRPMVTKEELIGTSILLVLISILCKQDRI